MDFQLVYRRGGDTPREETSEHARQVDAVAEAGRLARQDQAAGWRFVQLSYEVWNTSGRRRRKLISKVIQKAK